MLNFSYNFEFCFGVCVSSKQLMEQEEVDVVHPLDKERGISVEDFKLIKFHMSNRTIPTSSSSF